MDTPKKIGRYEILEELGRGAMGTVYRAKDPAMDRVVAVKTIISLVLASDQGSDFRERFYREARAAGALAHPGIVPVFDVGEHEGVPFLVMEFISGKTLANAVKKGERMTLDRVCEIGQKIAEALGYAHQRGVIHRDIKPANILLTSKEAHGIERPKITDFGVAKMAAGHTTLSGQILGTPAFMPPEQFTGAPVDGRADIFSLGVVLYLLTTGEQPFPGESMTAVSYKIMHTEPVPPRKLNPSISLKLEGIILKCLAKNPDERYQTGEDLARDLGQLKMGNTSVASNTPARQVAAPEIDPNATLFETLLPPAPGRATTKQPPEPVAAAKKSRANNLLVLSALVVVLIGAGGWFVLRHKGTPLAPAPATTAQSAMKPAAEVSEPAPAPPAAEMPAAAIPAPSAPKKQETKIAAAEEAALPKAGILSPATEPAAPEPVILDFDPKTLDPKSNAKLKIDAGQMPASLDFIVEMNGKAYLRRGVGGNKKEFDDLYVPSGVQEFRVTAGSGSVRKSSNTVSLEFRAKKRYTLRIELRTRGITPGAGVPQDLYPDTQLVLTLK